MENILVLPLALAIDLAIGSYPYPLHPVVWMGRVISAGLKIAPKRGNKARFVYGVFMVCFTVALFGVPVYFLLSYIRGLSPLAYLFLAALLLKATFSVRGLYRAAMKVKRLLAQSKIAEARKETGYLVSRDTKQLGRRALTSAVVEMSAESLTDAIVAPLFYWLLLGVPGAVAYRVVNTFDARIGYHGQYEYLGKFAARLDDVLNYIPARIAGLVLAAAAYLKRENGGAAWRIMRRDRSRTESPNAGWTMAAAAGALEVRLEKAGCYRLGDAVRPLVPDSITAASRLVALSSLLWVGLCIAISGVRYALSA
ncbi:MAG: cobalamin biosynthesis protein [Dehalococcoidia bacterium]